MPELQEVAWTALTLLSGSLLTLLGFWLKRYVTKSDLASTELRQAIDDVDNESMHRDQQIEQSLAGLRNYVDNEFARNRDMQAVEGRWDARFSSIEARFIELKSDMDARFGELKNDIDKNFDRLAGLIQKNL